MGRRTGETKRRGRKALPAHGWTALRCEHGVCARLAFGGVGGCDGVDDRLSFFVADFCSLESVRVLLCREEEGGERGKGKGELETYVDSSLARSARDFDRCYGLFGRTWSRG